MQFYNEEEVPFELEADWEYWNRMVRASLEDLCFIALGIDPRDFARESKRLNKYENELEMHGNFGGKPPDYDNLIRAIDAIENHQIKISLRQKALYEVVRPHFYDFFENGYEEVFIPEFIDLLKKLKIPYPEELDKNLFIEKKDDSKEKTQALNKEEKLTAGQKSSLTQRFNKLEQLFNEVALSKYGKGVTAYQIAQDEHVFTNEKTIKQYLKTK